MGEASFCTLIATTKLCTEDAGSENFKEFSALVKAEKQAIASSLRALVAPKSAL